jgi:hypothetical protein
MQISIDLFFTGYGSDTKFDVNKRQKERMMRKCVIEYIGAASEFIGTILFILCSSAIDLPADAESEITPVLSPITTTSRHEERGSHFLATIPTVGDALDTLNALCDDLAHIEADGGSICGAGSAQACQCREHRRGALISSICAREMSDAIYIAAP